MSLFKIILDGKEIYHGSKSEIQQLFMEEEWGQILNLGTLSTGDVSTPILSIKASETSSLFFGLLQTRISRLKAKHEIVSKLLNIDSHPLFKIQIVDEPGSDYEKGFISGMKYVELLIAKIINGSDE